MDTVLTSPRLARSVASALVLRLAHLAPDAEAGAGAGAAAAPLETTPTAPRLASHETWDSYLATVPAETPAAEPASEVIASEGPASPDAAESTSGAAPSLTQGADGRWHRADGTYANAEEIAAHQASAPAAAPAAEATPEPAAPAEEAPALHTVEIRGRDGKPVAIEVADESLAQLLRQNANDGMRAKDYKEKLAATEAERAEYRAFHTMLETNPEHVVFNGLSPEQQVNLTVKLIAQHWDAVVPVIQQYDQSDAARVRAAAETQLAIRDNSARFTETVSAQQRAVEITKAVTALVPDGWDDRTTERFIADAEQDIIRAVRAGEAVTTATIPSLLADRLALYGGGTPAAPQKPAAQAVRFAAAPNAPPPAPASSAAAIPIGDAAARLAAARAEQDRIRRTQQARSAAAAIPPAGAGAAPVRVATVPKGASIEDASKALRKMGNSWAAYSGT